MMSAESAATGSVEVTQQFDIEQYSHVMHLVSHVQGDLRDGLTAYDALRASFPAGTVSGAPKIRAMEIIAELEPDRSGPILGRRGVLRPLGEHRDLHHHPHPGDAGWVGVRAGRRAASCMTPTRCEGVRGDAAQGAGADGRHR